MGSTSAMGERVLRLLRSRSLTESVAFWIVLILVYLTLSGLAGLQGVGYSERVDEASRSVTFDLNPVLWFPDLFLHSYPATNPVPFLLWWVLLAVFITEAVMIVMRLLRGGPRAATRAPKTQGSRIL